MNPSFVLAAIYRDSRFGPAPARTLDKIRKVAIASLILKIKIQTQERSLAGRLRYVFVEHSIDIFP